MSRPREVAGSRPTRAWYCWLIAATMLAATLRLYHLQEASFWVDELNTVRACPDLRDMHWSKVLGYVPTALGMWAQGVNLSSLPLDHPEVWRSMGVNEWSARVGSCLVGILTVPVLGWVSCRLLGARAAAILAMLLAIAPWHIYWSQASRFYTLQFLLYSLSLIFYFVATEHASRARFTAALVFMVLAFLSQPPALVIAIVFATDWLVALLRGEPVRLRRFGWTATVIALAICAAVLAHDVNRRPEQWTQFAGDLYQTPQKMLLGTVFMINPPVALFALLSGWRLLFTKRRLGLYLVVGSIAPPLVFAALSLASYVGLRYAFVSLYGWLALAAIGTELTWHALRPRCGRVLSAAPGAVLVCSMMLMNYGYYTSGAGFHTRWRDAFAYVAAHRRPGERVYSDTHPMIGRYYLENEAVQGLPGTPDALVTDRPSWIVVEAEDVIRGRVKPWLGRAAALKAYFDVRVVAPYSSVRVYYHDASRR